MILLGIPDAHVIEDEDAADNMDSDPGTPDTSVTDGEGENSLTHSPGSTSMKVKERGSPDPVPRHANKQSNGPKIGKQAWLLLG